MRFLKFIFLFYIFSVSILFADEIVNTQLVVVGGGAGGVSAALQAARLGTQVVLVEETPWFGGMFTSAGVSAFDGNNYSFNTGIFKEVRTLIENYYGGPANVHTGWVSLCSFEPLVANQILQNLVASEPNITTYFEATLISVLKTSNRINGVVIKDKNGIQVQINAHITIDATEFGDVMEMGGVPYKFGRESSSETGEAQAPATPDDVLQDCTYCVILKRYPGQNRTWSQPPDGYDPSLFYGCCLEYSSGSATYTRDQMMDYGHLPNDKYMINWPIHGNDYYISLYTMTPTERSAAFEQAKLHTKRFIYLLQTELGLTELDIADDEYPTSDGMPFYPYIRESRRLIGASVFKVYDITNRYTTQSGDVYKTTIAVGNYPIDHHHSAFNRPAYYTSEGYPTIPKIGVPYFCLVPQEVNGFMAAEKSISVSHIVNGCTRLQPIVMLIGQATGAAAAIACGNNIEPGDVSVRELQQVLLDAGSSCFPMDDVYPDRWSFQSIQRICLAGVLKVDDQGRLTNFYPDNTLTLQETKVALEAALQQSNISSPNVDLNSTNNLKRDELAELIYEFANYGPPNNTTPYFTDVPQSHPFFNAIQVFYEKGLCDGWISPPNFYPDNDVTREQFAVTVDRSLDPFNKFPVPLVPEPVPIPVVKKLNCLWKLHHSNTTEGWTNYPASWFPSDSEPNRDMAYNKITGHLLIPNYSDKKIYIVDATNGSYLGELDSSLIQGGTLAIASVIVDDNGVIYATSYNANPLRIYRWANESSPCTIAYEGNISAAGGRAIDILGTGTQTKLYVSRVTDSGGFFIFITNDGVNFQLSQTVEASGFGTYGVYGLAVENENSVFIRGNRQELRHFVYSSGSGWSEDTSFDDSNFYYSGTSRIKFSQDKKFLFALAIDIYGPFQTEQGQLSETGIMVYKYGAGVLYDLKGFGVLEETVENLNNGGGVCFDFDNKTCFAMIPHNGYSAYDYSSLYSSDTSFWTLY